MRYGHLAMSLFCAWVLWSYIQQTGDWMPMESFKEKEACDIYAEGFNQSQDAKGKARSLNTCFPDTIDPRDTKGK